MGQGVGVVDIVNTHSSLDLVNAGVQVLCEVFSISSFNRPVIDLSPEVPSDNIVLSPPILVKFICQPHAVKEQFPSEFRSVFGQGART
jgi:hypothetical protein